MKSQLENFLQKSFPKTSA